MARLFFSKSFNACSKPSQQDISHHQVHETHQARAL
ncbi:hypothetical protein CCACVL1_13042 [Corchorus capsularis]|uniref:Uncharacterized protein n=1 Tax=Corchorus capsularis TaxID=210143 RepID=A0A1R3ICK7_COCAP|nr:hypothetical protein CCACVL1_13042 [Corchorus capsularis]